MTALATTAAIITMVVFVAAQIVLLVGLFLATRQQQPGDEQAQRFRGVAEQAEVEHGHGERS